MAKGDRKQKEKKEKEQRSGRSVGGNTLFTQQDQMPLSIHPTKSSQKSTNTKPFSTATQLSSSVIQHFWLRNNTIAGPHRSKRWQGRQKRHKTKEGKSGKKEKESKEQRSRRKWVEISLFSLSTPWLPNNTIAGPHRSKRRQREIENRRRKRWKEGEGVKGVGEGGRKYPLSPYLRAGPNVSFYSPNKVKPKKSTNTKHQIFLHSNPTASSVIQHFWLPNNTIAGPHRSKRRQREIENKRRKRWKEGVKGTRSRRRWAEISLFTQVIRHGAGRFSASLSWANPSSW
ncbi:hypothetical protein CEXT_35041 [Caerostris extrusa]|uniref:Uncharacterized protein n=1 Tax=Caerostris extrusa TaxID=172846 RepID=A0AAV4VGD2_CAEEX|nr:hypothetical protein CEXT_35041 [Caerostris extrusa]